jgi:hypothetical protein
VLEYVRSDIIPHSKCLDTLDMGEWCDAMFYLWSRYWLNIDEGLLLSALLNTRITYLCPS